MACPTRPDCLVRRPGGPIAPASSLAGDTIRLAAGTYELSEAIRLKSKIRLLGAGQDKTVLTYRGGKPSVLVNFTDCEDVDLAHMTLDGGSSPLVHQGITGSASSSVADRSAPGSRSGQPSTFRPRPFRGTCRPLRSAGSRAPCSQDRRASLCPRQGVRERSASCFHTSVTTVTGSGPYFLRIW